MATRARCRLCDFFFTMALPEIYCLNIQPQNNQPLKNVNKMVQKTNEMIWNIFYHLKNKTKLEMRLSFLLTHREMLKMAYKLHSTM